MSSVILFAIMILAICTVIQMHILWVYSTTLQKRLAPHRADDSVPGVMAIQCLRGTDPDLRAGLQRLIASNYPGLHVRFVLDSIDDPALPIVQEVVERVDDERVEYLILPRRQPFCSGKASALLYGTEDLPEGCEIVVVIDGDAMLYPDTISQLVRGMRDPQVGIAAGNRWYHPRTDMWGSLIRMAWNAYCLPVVSYAQIPWGGCMAVRASDFSDPEFRQMLGAAYTDDSTIASFVRKRNRKIEYISDVTLLNQEEISLPAFYRFLIRQLMTIRLNNSRSMTILSYMIVLNLIFVITPVLILIQPMSPLGMLATGIYLGLLAITGLGHPLGHFHIRKVLRERGEPLPSSAWSQLLKFPTAVLAMNLMNVICLTRIWFLHQLTWRGITYRIEPDNRISIAHVKPMRASELSRISAE